MKERREEASQLADRGASAAFSLSLDIVVVGWGGSY